MHVCLAPAACGDVCVICVCLQERGRADGSIDHREYANHVYSKQHFSKQLTVDAMTKPFAAAATPPPLGLGRFKKVQSEGGF